MSKCRICGRPLTARSSVATGVGPVCAGRGYQGRIRARFGSGLGGWSEIEEWEKVNHPCYSCKLFEFPHKDNEIIIPDGYRVEMHGVKADFDKNGIGGFCRNFLELVDGNLINEKCACKGSEYIARKKEDEQPQVGLLHGRDGQVELFEI